MTLFPNKVSQTIAWTQTIISLGCMIGEYCTVLFLRVPCNKKLCLDKWHGILIGTITQVRSIKKSKIPTIEI